MPDVQESFCQSKLCTSGINAHHFYICARKNIYHKTAWQASAAELLKFVQTFVVNKSRQMHDNSVPNGLPLTI